MSVGQVLTPEGIQEVEETDPSKILERYGIERNTSSRFHSFPGIQELTGSQRIGEDQIPDQTDDLMIVGDVEIDKNGSFLSPFDDSKNIHIESSYFRNRENDALCNLGSSTINIDKISAVQAFNETEDTKINSEVLSTKNIGRSSRELVIESDEIDARRVGKDSSELKIDSGKISAQKIGLNGSGIRIKSDEIDLRHRSHPDTSFGNLFGGAEDSIAETEKLIVGKTLNRSRDSLVISEKTEVKPQSLKLGRGSRGSVLASKKIGKVKSSKREMVTNSKILGRLIDRDVGKEFSEDLTVFTSEKSVSNSKYYKGDWDELTEYLQDAVPRGMFEALDLFEIDEEFERIEELENQIEEVNELFSEVENEYREYERIKTEFDLPDIQGSNEEIYRRFTEFDNVAAENQNLNVEAVKDPEIDNSLISFSPLDYLVEFRGNWDELKNYVDEDLEEEKIAGLELFDLEEVIEGREELKESLDEIDEMFQQVRQKYEKAKEVGKHLDLNLGETNREKFETLKETDYRKYCSIVGNSKVDIFAKGQQNETEIFLSNNKIAGDQLRIQDSLERIDEILEDFDTVDFEFLKLFDLKESYETAEEFREEVKEYKEKFDEVSEEYRISRETDILEFDLPDTNQARYEMFSKFEENILAEQLGIDQETASSLMDSDKRTYIFKNLDKLGGRSLKKSYEEVKESAGKHPALGVFRILTEGLRQSSNKTKMVLGDRLSQEEFLDTFTGEKPEEYLLEPEFENRVYIDPDNEVSDDPEEVKGESYRQGLELLEEIRLNEVNWEIDREVDIGQETIEEIEEFNRKKEDIRADLEAGKEVYEDVKEEMQRISDKIDEVEQEYVRRIFEEKTAADLGPLEDQNFQGLDPEDSDISPDAVRAALDNASQHLLKKRSDPYYKALRAIDGMEIAGDDVSGGELRISVYDKTLEPDMPDNDESRCCAFPGGIKDSTALEYLEDPYTQILEVEKGDKKGYAIAFELRSPLGEYLYVDTIESRHHLFKDETVAENVAESIEMYSEEADLDGAIFNIYPNDSAPEEFLENLDRDKYSKNTFMASKRGKTHYNESVPPISALSPVEIPVYRGLMES